MKLSVLLTCLVVATLLASACLVAILIYFSPFASEEIIFVLFYASLFISSTGILTLIGMFIRWISYTKLFHAPLRRGMAMRQFEISFRQGMLLALVLLAVLILQGQRILFWWHLILIVGLVALAEWWLMRK